MRLGSLNVNALDNRTVHACVKSVPKEAAEVFMCQFVCSTRFLYAYAIYRSVHGQSQLP